jgi:hypothetical protein
MFLIKDCFTHKGFAMTVFLSFRLEAVGWNGEI